MNTKRGLLPLLIVGTLYSAELQPEALQAWQAYVECANTRMKAHLDPKSRFLSADTDPAIAERLRNGDILVWPSDSGGTKTIRSGLINDWTGAVFMLHTTLDDVLSVIRDYDCYKIFYSPTVLASRTLARTNQAITNGEDRFSMLLMRRSLFTTMVLDSEYKCSSVRVDARRSYSLSETTRVQEVEQYGTPDQREIREGEGNGLIWRLFSITRLEQRDGGVYMELQVMALSRDVPASLRWMIEPIVRRVSTNTLSVSLRQTAEAVRSRDGHTSNQRASRAEGQAFLKSGKR